MKTIPLTQGYEAVVDDIDYEWLSRWKWYVADCHGNFYACRNIRVSPTSQRRVWMHREILGLRPLLESDPRLGDHISGDTMDNRRINLRIVTARENIINRSIQRNNSTGKRGVTWHRRVGAWQARIGNKGTRIHLGYFATLDLAAEAYGEAAIKYHGEFRRI